MLNTLVILLLSFLQVNCLNSCLDYSVSLDENSNQIDLETGYSQNYTIKYDEGTNFNFNIKDNDTYQVNIHTINCNVKIDFNGEIMNQINLDTYSLKINKSNTNIKIKPLIDVISGEEIENYEEKICYVTINSVNENVPVVTIQNKEGAFFYFEDYNNLTISYDFIRTSFFDVTALFFQFNENSNFSVNVTCRDNNLIYKNIYNSTYIYLHNGTFAKYSNNYVFNNLNIYIEKYDYNKPINLFFKIVENAKPIILQKNALNYCFSTSSTENQFFYFEVFKGEEGEINLHYKRFEGILMAIIVKKDEVNYTDLFNINTYYITDKQLYFNPHNSKLQYTYKDTLNCNKGCYILLVYEIFNCYHI